MGNFLNISSSLINNCLHTGITTKTYRLRADILCDVFGTSVKGNINLVNCYSSVAYVTSKTLINCPSIEHEVSCSKGCTNYRKTMNILLLDNSDIMKTSFDNVIKDYLTLTPKMCQTCNTSTTAEVIAAGATLKILLLYICI